MVSNDDHRVMKIVTDKYYTWKDRLLKVTFIDNCARLRNAQGSQHAIGSCVIASPLCQ